MPVEELNAAQSFVAFLRTRGESEATILRILIARVRGNADPNPPWRKSAEELLAYYRGDWLSVPAEALSAHGVTRGQLYARAVDFNDHSAGKRWSTTLKSAPLPLAPRALVNRPHAVRALALPANRSRTPRRNVRSGRAKARAPGRLGDDPDPESDDVPRSPRKVAA